MIDRDPGPGYSRDSCFFSGPGPGPGKLIFKIPAPARGLQFRPRPRLFLSTFAGVSRICYLNLNKKILKIYLDFYTSTTRHKIFGYLRSNEKYRCEDLTSFQFDIQKNFNSEFVDCGEYSPVISCHVFAI